MCSKIWGRPFAATIFPAFGGAFGAAPFERQFGAAFGAQFGAQFGTQFGAAFGAAFGAQFGATAKDIDSGPPVEAAIGASNSGPEYGATIWPTIGGKGQGIEHLGQGRSNQAGWLRVSSARQNC